MHMGIHAVPSHTDLHTTLLFCRCSGISPHASFISFHRAGCGAQAGRVVMVGGGTVAKYDAVPTAVEVSAEFSQE